ncbi:hypothetical protein [Streptomyces violaceusniger]|uniref:Transposase DDE domain-containing protein n=1 Tax=Streptomyces violaceusniger TaxID=68280 RepID=A0A4D4KZ03_STRVO|nr:hypothetical protein SVIO_027490 [Streptomyces violaceusniger]
MIAAVRLRQGKSADSRGAERFVTEALATAGEAGCTGTRLLRADSQFYNADVVAACRRAGAHFSITTGMNPSSKRAIAAIPEGAWTPIRYPRAVTDPDTGELISNAQVTEIPAYTAFTGRRKAEQVTARLIVRRVRDPAKPATIGEQGERLRGAGFSCSRAERSAMAVPSPTRFGVLLPTREQAILGRFAASSLFGFARQAEGRASARCGRAIL